MRLTLSNSGMINPNICFDVKKLQNSKAADLFLVGNEVSLPSWLFLTMNWILSLIISRRYLGSHLKGYQTPQGEEKVLDDDLNDRRRTLKSEKLKNPDTTVAYKKVKWKIPKSMKCIVVSGLSLPERTSSAMTCPCYHRWSHSSTWEVIFLTTP